MEGCQCREWWGQEGFWRLTQGMLPPSLEGTSPELFEQIPLEEIRLLLRLILSHGLFLREQETVSAVFFSFLVVISW